ncbi:HD-like signal output (HDOD) domain, no enzymatic activity [Noviherbaspirillum humi]|uniref:HD-like signal output (HDOD) domain, no enzymatic activity n=1 Tax=Noviherbaspirillum humi TaxID=1688639 RepID=A0A239JEG2_9BURK|nr:HDOD domain-containing protein [Noviherbaspirillum humi]SNT04187.1 HD-like signal output (HDOD) domain, no enzymatic activity [Noviherbaspirillum humi]
MSPLKPTPPLADETMALLWSRVRQRGDMPGFSKVIHTIISAMQGDEEREFNMTRTVLSDPALTQKVLRLANSAMYSVFGQGINTVSKAVIVLGTETIGHLALGLKLIDGLTNASTDSSVARQEMEKAVLAGHIARQVASSAGTRDSEEAVVCSMLHGLGRMMVTFYLTECWEAVQEKCRQGMGENEAAVEVLGLGLDEVGRLAGRQWGLPGSLTDTFRHVVPRDAGEPLDHAEWLATVSTLSSRCADALYSEAGPQSPALVQLAQDYADMLGLEFAQVLTAVSIGQDSAVEENAIAPRPARATEPPVSLPPALGKPADAAQRLQRGLADMRDALGNASLPQVMTMALETVHQGLGFSRAIAFIRDQEEGLYRVCMSFGEGVQEKLPQLRFGDAYQPDVFHAALANDKMIFVENARDPVFVKKLPRWWREALPSVRSFTLLPLMVNRQPVGFIYGDWDLLLPPARIESADVAPLNELRVLAVQAIERQRQVNPQWVRMLL